MDCVCVCACVCVRARVCVCGEVRKCVFDKFSWCARRDWSVCPCMCACVYMCVCVCACVCVFMCHTVCAECMYRFSTIVCTYSHTDLCECVWCTLSNMRTVKSNRKHNTNRREDLLHNETLEFRNLSCVGKCGVKRPEGCVVS